MSEYIILKLEQFVVLVYCRTSDDMHVNSTWMTLFSQMSCKIENTPSTQAALDQHIKSSSYQMIRSRVGTVTELPAVTDWGWETSQTTGYIPKWTTLPIAKVACLALVSCKCVKSCKGNCNCFKADLECTPLCKCAGTCYT